MKSSVEPGARRSPSPVQRKQGSWIIVCQVVAIVAAAMMLSFTPPAASAHAALDSGTLTIDHPTQGPVGATIFGTVKNGSHSHTFAVGYAGAVGCLLNFNAIPGASNFTIKNDGTAAFNFAWPSSTDTGSYFVCARDIASPLQVLQSTNKYAVLSTSAPSITVAPAPGAAGTPTPTPDNSGNTTFYAGEQVQITGSNFLPGGTTVSIYYSGVENGLGTQLQSGINAGVQGDFQTTVTLPNFRTGVLYLQAATEDNTNGNAPSLLATAQIMVTQPPTATPTPTTTPNPSPTSATGSSGNSPQQPGSTNGSDAPRVFSIVGLSTLSVLLLVVGAVFLITGSRARRQF
jgi:hypothetical protein